jgi:hypothetical protein
MSKYKLVPGDVVVWRNDLKRKNDPGVRYIFLGNETCTKSSEAGRLGDFLQVGNRLIYTRCYFRRQCLSVQPVTDAEQALFAEAMLAPERF